MAAPALPQFYNPIRKLKDKQTTLRIVFSDMGV